MNEDRFLITIDAQRRSDQQPTHRQTVWMISAGIECLQVAGTDKITATVEANHPVTACQKAYALIDNPEEIRCIIPILNNFWENAETSWDVGKEFYVYHNDNNQVEISIEP